MHCFAGHIACDCNSNAEIVVPLLNDAGEVLGVLDIDSPVSGRFDGDDLDGLEAAAAFLAKKIAAEQKRYDVKLSCFSAVLRQCPMQFVGIARISGFFIDRHPFSR